MTTNADALRRAKAAGPAALAEFRAARSADKRRQRERWRAAGLSSDGKPLRDRAQSERMRRVAGAHPASCPCYDCGWGRFDREADARTVRRGRVLGA